MSDDILNNAKYHVFAILDQYAMILRVRVESRDDHSKAVQRKRAVTFEECTGDGYEKMVREMAKECEKELENG